MADTDNDQKTEQPTEKRLSEAAEKGQFAKSAELTVVFTLTAALAALAFTVRQSANDVAEYSVMMFTNFRLMQVNTDTFPLLLGNVLLTCAKAVLPVLVACAGAAMLAGGLQSGFRISPKAMMPKFEHLNPVEGFMRLFSKATWVRSGLDLLKLVAIGYALYLGARNLLEDPLFTAPVEAAYLGTFLREASTAFFGRLLLSLGVIAALSYGWEKFKMHRDMMMTRQEVKDEHKNSEGDQHVKGAMRRMARRLLQKQMLAAVATADVVVTNPTHYAVALVYNQTEMQAPKVVAKGVDAVAQKIREVAAEANVPVVENPPLARGLYASVEIDQEVPPEFYKAVAEVIGYIYKLKKKRL